MSQLRSKAALIALRSVNATSRRLGRGQGTVAGGNVGLRLDPGLLAYLAQGRRSVLVSGTNGKTTTTALVAAALGGSGAAVASNSTGSNMPAGHVAALASSRTAPLAALEVDEAYLPQVLTEIHPEVVLLLNLSRDQLDRMSEVRMLAERWQRALFEHPETMVVANADDPLVAFAARGAARVCWVAGGLAWSEDATGCPACGGAIRFAPDGWSCGSCSFARPLVTWRLDGSVAVGPKGPVPLEVRLPGAFNRCNALMALAAASALSIEPGAAAEGIGSVSGVAGRFETISVAGTPARLMLAKNPAGFAALLELAAEDDGPVVIAINARTADGFDPSWLFDVDFSVLGGRPVIAAGERALDLAVRLTYNGVAHETHPDLSSAVRHAGANGGAVDVIANYTAFWQLRSQA